VDGKQLRQRWAGWFQRHPLPLPMAHAVMLALAMIVAIGIVWFWRGPAGLAILAGIAFAAVLVLWVVPGLLVPPVPEDDLAAITDPKDRLEAADARLRLRHELRNGMLQTLVVVGVLASAWLGFQQLAEDRDSAAAARELTRQGQASERFTRAINQLGDRRVETRIGGIYGLAQVAEQAPDNSGPVGEVLVAYINRLPRPKVPEGRLSEHAPDVQAALTVLTQYDKDHDGAKDYAWLSHRLDLHQLGLREADLRGADLRGANLTGTDLTGAKLAGADLSIHPPNAGLADADLPTKLPVATLSFADLRGARLSGANLHHADLRAADLSSADLRGAYLSFADLFGANLRGANLTGAKR
jgi:hypothetical protein